MFLNRHLVILLFSVLFIGVIFWWEEPETAVSAMARGEYTSNPYSIVKNYWKRLDYRQFDLALEMTDESARKDHAKIQQMLTENPFLSIQKTNIQVTSEKDTFLVENTLGSSIDQRKEINYVVKVEQTSGGWRISSLKTVP